MIQLDYRDPRPIYEQIKEGIYRLIVSGTLPENSRLPSVRELAVSMTINPNTIQRAYKELESEGYIVSVPGKGSFVSPGNAALTARRAELCARLREAAAELRRLGVSDDEITALLKEDESND